MKDSDGIRIHYPFPDPPARGKAIEVADGVLWLRLPLPMALDHVNVFAFDEGDGWTIIDTGFRSRVSIEIWGDLLKGPLQGRPVKRLIVTHHHPDHIGLAGWFVSEHGAELITPRTAWLFARMLTLDEQPVPNEQTLSFFISAGMDPDVLAQRRTERPFNFADCVAPLPLGFTRLSDGNQITIGGRDWDVRFGHGHAPDQATFWSTDGKLVIGGDQLLPSISPNLGVYATEPEADPVAEWLESCERLSAFATEDQLVLPGHKLPFTGLPLRMRQLADNHHGALARLEEFLETPHTAAECFPPIFLRPIKPAEYGLALVEALAHVMHLWHQGKARRERRKDGAWLWQTIR